MNYVLALFLTMFVAGSVFAADPVPEEKKDAGNGSPVEESDKKPEGDQVNK